MSDLITWCDAHEGFCNALLSFIGGVLSIIAIVVSINTARLPYKRKIKVSASTGILFSKNMITSHVNSEVANITVNAANVGNRDVNITFLGLVIRDEKEENKVVKITEKMDGEGIIHPSEIHCNSYSASDIINSFSKLSDNAKAYAYVQDSEGNHYKKYIGKAAEIAKNMRQMR